MGFYVHVYALLARRTRTHPTKKNLLSFESQKVSLFYSNLVIYWMWTQSYMKLIMWHIKLTFIKFYINYLDMCTYTLLFFFFCETFAEKTQSKCGQWKCSKHGFQLCEQLLLHILWEMCFIKQKMHWRPQQQQASSKICEVTRKYTSTQVLLHR